MGPNESQQKRAEKLRKLREEFESRSGEKPTEDLREMEADSGESAFETFRRGASKVGDVAGRAADTLGEIEDDTGGTADSFFDATASGGAPKDDFREDPLVSNDGAGNDELFSGGGPGVDYEPEINLGFDDR